MEKIITKWMTKWWWVVVIVLLGGVYGYGLGQMYFHQDDLDWFLMANRSWVGVIAAPIADHVDYLYRILLKIEWDSFHLYFPGYFSVSVLMHALVVWLLYKLANMSTNRHDLAAYVAIIFSINMNWSETVLWVSGQTITITVLVVLLTMIAIYRQKNEAWWMILSGMTSALALGLPVSAILSYGRQGKKWKMSRLGYASIATIFIVALVYYFFSTDGTKIEFGIPWAVKVVLVWGLMTINSVVGRLVIPFDRFETIRIWVVSIAALGIVYKLRDNLAEIWSDRWSQMLILQLGVYNLIVAAGRAQYGVGIMRADRYSYLGLALLLLLLARTLRKVKIGKWVYIVPVLVAMQCMGFYVKARAYVQRPQQLKSLMERVAKTDKSQIDPEAYLPEFVSGDLRLKYKDLSGLIDH